GGLTRWAGWPALAARQRARPVAVAREALQREAGLHAPGDRYRPSDLELRPERNVALRLIAVEQQVRVGLLVADLRNNLLAHTAAEDAGGVRQADGEVVLEAVEPHLPVVARGGIHVVDRGSLRRTHVVVGNRRAVDRTVNRERRVISEALQRVV